MVSLFSVVEEEGSALHACLCALLASCRRENSPSSATETRTGGGQAAPGKAYLEGLRGGGRGGGEIRAYALDARHRHGYLYKRGEGGVNTLCNSAMPITARRPAAALAPRITRSLLARRKEITLLQSDISDYPSQAGMLKAWRNAVSGFAAGGTVAQRKAPRSYRRNNAWRQGAAGWRASNKNRARRRKKNVNAA